MKEIKAIIQTSMLDKVLGGLRKMKGLPGCTVSHVHGCQRSGGGDITEPLAPAERTKIEIVVKDGDVKRVVASIADNARTGSPGDGKIFVIDCIDAIQIRTGKHGEQVL